LSLFSEYLHAKEKKELEEAEGTGNEEVRESEKRSIA